MTVSAIEATPATPGQPIDFTSQTDATTADKDMFLKLLVAQMRFQDPMNPTDSSEFLSQSAQFTALEKMSSVAEQTSQLVGLQMAFGASSLVGQTVAYPQTDGTTASGVVSSVRFTSTGPILQVDGQDVSFTDVISVGDGSTDLTATPSGGTSTNITGSADTATA